VNEYQWLIDVTPRERLEELREVLELARMGCSESDHLPTYRRWEVFDQAVNEIDRRLNP
jgi:hypothetical protein